MAYSTPGPTRFYYQAGERDDANGTITEAEGKHMDHEDATHSGNGRRPPKELK